MEENGIERTDKASFVHPTPKYPAGPKNVQKKVRKNVRQVCYILLANSRVCGRVTGAMPLLTLQVAKFEAISLKR